LTKPSSRSFPSRWPCRAGSGARAARRLACARLRGCPMKWSASVRASSLPANMSASVSAMIKRGLMRSARRTRPRQRHDHASLPGLPDRCPPSLLLKRHADEARLGRLLPTQTTAPARIPALSQAIPCQWRTLGQLRSDQRLADAAVARQHRDGVARDQVGHRPLARGNLLASSDAAEKTGKI
jgi:hypothetical protein